MPVRFDRSLDERFLSHLKTKLAWLARVSRQQHVGCALDPQFRERSIKSGKARRGGNAYALYYGTTKLLNAEWSARGGEALTFSAKGKHLTSDTDGFLKTYEIERVSSVEVAAQKYLSSAMAGAQSRYFTPSLEGYWQNLIAWNFGPQWNPEKEFLVVDRESVLGFDSRDEKGAWFEQIRRVHMEIAEEIRQANPKRFSKPVVFGDELDLLAIDRHGRLVCIELKRGGSPSGIYWAPLQALSYRDSFRKAASVLHAGVTKLVQQKIELGMLPEEAARVVPKRPWTDKDIHAVVAIGRPHKESRGWDAWKALRIVQQALKEPVPVLLVDTLSDSIEASWHEDWPLPPPVYPPPV